MLYQNEKTKNISFPLGGIGTGCIGLAGNGELSDFEIFNRPNKNAKHGYTHFAIKAITKDTTCAKVLQGDTAINLTGRNGGFGYGPESQSMAGYPHFRNVSFDGFFPIAKLCFTDPDFPVPVRLTAFNPFIPHNEYDSSLPAAFFEWEIENTTNDRIDFALAFSVYNPSPMSKNYKEDGGCGLVLENGKNSKDEIGYHELCILCDGDDTSLQPYWYRGSWMDSITTYWKNFAELDRIPERDYPEPGKNDHGTLSAYFTLDAGEKKKLRFVFSWYVPNQYNYWKPCKDENDKDVIWKNYYATQFNGALSVARYSLSNFDRLLSETERFTEALMSSSLPPSALDAVSANLSVLKSPTVLRLEDGSLWGWEGVSSTVGSCEGSCQHVWNYAYALAFLFPALERSLRENTFKYALKENGESAFRIALPVGRNSHGFRPCIDGQMGEVIKCFREWKFSGDTQWLKNHSEKIFSMLEFAWSEENRDKWDIDCDGVLEGRGHHTLDVELFGPSSWLQGFYLLALDCAAEMADALGENKRADKYREIYARGRAWTNENLFNGEYFIQKVNLEDKSAVDKFDAGNYWNSESGEIKYQIADGCIIDQMLSDYHAALIGMNGVFDKEKKDRALDSLYKYNYKPSMREVTNMWRNFALNDESGTVICSYPKGAKVPAIPIPYCEECMTGFEYSLGALMIAEGKINEGENIVSAVRERYNGENRNPWNEIECGNNYARSMASFSLLPIYSGFSFDMTRGRIGFSPVIQAPSKFMFSVKNTYGTVEFADKKVTLNILASPLSLREFCHSGRACSVKVDGNSIEFTSEDGRVSFDDTIIEKTLEVEYS